MQKRKLKKISLLVSSAALVLALTVPVKAGRMVVVLPTADKKKKNKKVFLFHIFLRKIQHIM